MQGDVGIAEHMHNEEINM